MKHKHLIGMKLEDFKVNAYRQGELLTVDQSALEGCWSLFFFYPADFTFVCPTELKDMADFNDEFEAENCHIYSVSTDSEFVHKAWADASDTIRSLPYTMVADPAWKLSKMLGVIDKEAGQAYRAAFIVGPDKTVRAYEVNDMGIGRNAEELLRVLRAAKFVEEHGDQVCPAKWKPGEETLKPSLDLVGLL